MTYKILSLEEKQFDWGIIKRVTLAENTGTNHQNVSIKSDFPNFAGLKVGDVVDGSLYTSDKGYKTLYPPRTGTESGNGAPRGSGGAIKAMERKAEMVEKAQESKEHGIKTSSTIGKAVDIAIAQMGGATFNDAEMKDKISFWRKYLWETWDYDDQIPF